MADPFTMLAVGALVGALKNEVSDKPQAAADRKLAAETIRNSPWTGMKPGEIHKANLFNNALAGAGTGLSMSKGFGEGAAMPGEAGSFGGGKPTLGVDTSMPMPNDPGFFGGQGGGGPGFGQFGKLDFQAPEFGSSIGPWDAMARHSRGY